MTLLTSTLPSIAAAQHFSRDNVASTLRSTFVDILAAGFQNDNEYDDLQDTNRKKLSRKTRPSAETSILSVFQNQQQLGALLLGIGILLSILGMMLLFERNLLRLGNIGIIVGICLLIGPNRVRSFFMKESRIRATIFTLFGVFLVFIGKPRLGILCEIFGLLNLFGNMLPLILALGKKLPIVGDILSALDGSSNIPGRNGQDNRQQSRRRERVVRRRVDEEDSIDPHSYPPPRSQQQKRNYPEF